MQPFDFIKQNIIQKLACKIKFNGQINGGSMFFRSARIKFFKLVGSTVSNMERINVRKRNAINRAQCSMC